MSDAPVYLIIGASGGIGTQLCRRLVDRGARLLMAARHEELLRTLAGEFNQPHAVCDATDWAATESCVNRTIELYGRIDGAVNLAGSLLLKPAHLTSFDEFQSTVQQNMSTAFGLIRAAAPAMKKSGGGSIVLMSSAAADIGLSSHEAIAACKAGVSAMARSAAATYAAGNVRINSVAPGLVRTTLTERVWKSDRAAEASVLMHPLGRLGEPRDVASLIDWLIHPEQTWITGQQIAIDGGLSSLKNVAKA